MISVITPTVRLDGLKVVKKSLLAQSFQDFEWVVCSPELPSQILESDFNRLEWVKDDSQGGFWGLNRAYNKLFEAARGSIIVSWQDWVWAPPDALQKFIDAFDQLGKDVVISGVGDQYEKVGKFGKPEIKIWSDPRKNLAQGSFYECYPNDCEWNFCAFPKVLMYEIGGMDEQLDFLGYGGDQLQVGERLDTQGVKFYLDQTNESFTVRHDRSKFGGEENWNKNHVLFNGAYDKRKEELKLSGQWPILTYLK